MKIYTLYCFRVFVLVFTFFIIFPRLSFGQIFEFRNIAAGADTSEIYINSYWFDDDTTKWGAVFHSINNGKELSVQYKNVYPGTIVYANIYGDSLSGSLYNMWGLNFSHDFGITWEYKATPITNYFEGIAGCLLGEIYIQGNINTGEKALYHGTHFGDSLYLMNTQMAGMLCLEAGSLPGELYAIQWPYYGYYQDTLGLAFSNDYGQTFSVNYLTSSLVTHLYQYTLAHGHDTGELYLTGLDGSDRYHILHSVDYGQTFTLQYLTDPIYYGWDHFSFVAGRKPGIFYILKHYLAPTVPLHTIMEIHYSQDYGETYTIYYHELDSTYTGIPSASITSNPIRIYPNPVSDLLTVELPGNFGDATVSLFDITGRLQLTRQIPAGRKKEQIDLSSLKQGIYLLNVIVQGRIIGAEKVVVGQW